MNWQPASWRARRRAPESSRAETAVPRTELDAFAATLEPGRLSPEQFVRVLETLHLLGTTGAGADLASLSTPTLVNIVHRASREQINALAEHHELRQVFLHEIFRRMGEQFDPERARYVSLVVAWRFPRSGEENAFDRYQLVIEDGRCVSGPDLGLTPDTTITVAVDDFIRLATGVAAVAPMFVTGKVKIRGEYAPAIRLSSYFDMPTPR